MSFQKQYENIAYFLDECVKNNWDLDVEDIKQILQGNFDFVRDSNTIESTYDTVEDAVDDLQKTLGDKRK